MSTRRRRRRLGLASSVLLSTGALADPPKPAPNPVPQPTKVPEIGTSTINIMHAPAVKPNDTPDAGLSEPADAPPPRPLLNSPNRPPKADKPAKPTK